MMNQLITSKPSTQNEVDLFKHQWLYHLPVPDTVAGTFHYGGADGIIDFAVNAYGGTLANFDVLELGPNEGEISYKLARFLPRTLTSIEGRTSGYLKSLIAANILGFRSRILLGDFVQFLKDCDRKFDLNVVCGVLYHMVNPVEFLELCCKVSDRLIITTHYFDHQRLVEARAKTDVSWAMPDGGKGFRVMHNGFGCEYFRHEYGPAGHEGSSGGLEYHAHFMKRDDILSCLAHFGHAVLHEHDDPASPRGPFLWAVTQRKR